MKHARVVVLLLLCSAGAVVSCGSGGAAPLPAVSATRDSGQSHMMDKTFAGQNKCSAKDHERPFVIEWDATDMSSFEARAAGDVVVVKYEGCHLEVLDHCSNDSIKGALGAYGAVEWTSGSVEKIDVANEAELYAKLPLGAASLGGRLEAGEQFHMEYYVTGTKKSTRADLYRPDLDAIPGCRGATHFVYAYNLGAFALGSTRRIKAGVDATVWGIGAGAKQQSLSGAEKKGGALTSCTGVSAHEVASCQVPIRLTLRPIVSGDNPDAVAANADETPTAKNLAGKIDAKLKGGENARAHYEAAIERHHANDGKGCVRELDAHDKLQTTPTLRSTSARSYIGFYRAECLMLAGQCNAGRELSRKWYETSGPGGVNSGPVATDRFVESESVRYCQGAQKTPREQLLASWHTLIGAGSGRQPMDAAACTREDSNVKRLLTQVPPADESDEVKYVGAQLVYSYAACLAKAGDCATALNAYRIDKATTVDAFNIRHPSCKGKVGP
jgi:hypothetical protein